MRERLSAVFAALEPVEQELGPRTASAVMVLVHGAESDERLVFQVRTHVVRHHKGEISFPGGRRDLDDSSLLHTALRETHEEVGVPPEAIRVLGALDDVETLGSNHLIRPYVGLLDHGVPVEVTATGEVHELLHVPLAHLLRPESRVWKVVDREGAPTPTEAYEYEGHVIWGATARILAQLLDLLDEGQLEGARA